MRAVLYAYDLEPITIIDVPLSAIDHLRKHSVVRIHVPTYQRVMPSNLAAPVDCEFKVVTIRAEKFVFGDQETMMLFTHDEETALQMKAAFLPGQFGAMQDMQRNAFAYGFLTALRKLGESDGY